MEVEVEGNNEEEHLTEEEKDHGALGHQADFYEGNKCNCNNKEKQCVTCRKLGCASTAAWKASDVTSSCSIAGKSKAAPQNSKLLLLINKHLEMVFENTRQKISE